MRRKIVTVLILPLIIFVVLVAIILETGDYISNKINKKREVTSRP